MNKYIHTYIQTYIQTWILQHMQRSECWVLHHHRPWLFISAPSCTKTTRWEHACAILVLLPCLLLIWTCAYVCLCILVHTYIDVYIHSRIHKEDMRVVSVLCAAFLKCSCSFYIRYTYTQTRTLQACIQTKRTLMLAESAVQAHVYGMHRTHAYIHIHIHTYIYMHICRRWRRCASQSREWQSSGTRCTCKCMYVYCDSF